MKSFILLLLFQLTLLAVGQPVIKLVDIDVPSKNIVPRRAHRYPRALTPDPPTCSLNQYFDEEEGRCLGVTGGGKVLYINSTNSCGINTLQPHCTSPRYYYICKTNKIILAQCLQGQHFESRLQKCVNVDPDRLISSTIQPNLETFESIQLPECKKPGSFPVPDDCTLFYTCETNGHRMFHSIFRCPGDMAYNAETKMCSFSSSCKQENSTVSFCAPMITKEKRNVEKSTNTESLAHITDLDDTDTTTTYEISTTENLKDTAVTNTVSMTIYNNDESTSTFSFNDLTSTEFTEVTVHVDVIASTEPALSTSYSLDTETSTAYLATNEQELVSKEEISLFTETTTVMNSTPETEKSVEESITEAVTETSIFDSITSNREIQTTAISMAVTEKVVEVTEVTASTMAPVDLSAGTEIQTIEIDQTDSSLNNSTSTEKIVEQSITTIGLTEDVTISTTDLSTFDNAHIEVQTTTKTEMNDDESTTSEMEFTDSATIKSSNERTNSDPISLSNTAISKESLNENENSNVLSTISSDDANTESTFLPTTTISTASSVQEPAVNFNMKNVSSTSTVVVVSSSENNKQNATSKENDIREKEFVTMLKTIHSTGRISTDIILPIMSAVLSIIDSIERCLIDILSRVQS